MMSEELTIIKGSKEEQYLELIPQIAGLIGAETDLIANLANICSALHQQFGWLWTGFYLVKEDDLVLGPFQGPVACTRIKKGRGVCGIAWQQMKTIIVQDVNQFPGHITCSSLSKSEIVIPVIRMNKVVAVLDIDHSEYGTFDHQDELFLSEIVSLIPVKIN
jgi:L-methionine (R)-S-oxide reductase